MSGPAVGTRDYLAQRGIKAWAAVPLEYLQREIEPDRCADSRLRHLMILWGWCGPEATEYVSIRDERNRLVLDEKRQPIPARRKDLARLLGMDEGNVSRFLKRFKRQGALVFEGGRMYLVYKPAAFDPKTQKVVNTTTFHIADIVVSTDNLPTDKVVRTEALRFLEQASTDWKNALKDVRTHHRELFKQRALAFGILIEKKNRRVREESYGGGGSVRSGEDEEKPAAAAVPAPLRSDEVAQIVACASQVSDLDWSGAELILDAVRAIAPDAPVSAINCWIQKKAPKAIKSKNPSGFLIRAVPECFQGDWRAVLTLPAAPKPEDETERRERERIAQRKANLAAMRAQGD